MASEAKEFKTKYPKDLETLNTMLIEKGIILGDTIKVATKSDNNYCGNYVENTEAFMSIRYDPDGSVKYGDGGLMISLSTLSVKEYAEQVKYITAARKDFFTRNSLFPEVPKFPETKDILVREIKQLEKLVVENK
jgi:hypothetical protein